MAIYGAIKERWDQLGGPASYLGNPLIEEADFPQGGRWVEFQNGGIYWWSDTGPIDLRDVVVHYTGLYCFQETDWDQGSDSDEPYAILAVTAPTGVGVFQTQVYQDVDDSESRPDLIEIYRGRPFGINILSIVMEQDFGDPNAYRQEVQDTVMGAYEAARYAVGLVPYVGPALAKLAEAHLTELMPGIGGDISDLFNWGDDRIGGHTLTLTARQMVLLAARTQNSDWEGIGFKAESDYINGHGASYKTYFGLIPG